MGSARSVVLAAPVRTAIGTFGGSLKEVPAPDLGAAAIGGSVARAGLRPEEIGTVVMGNVIQAGNKMNPARQAAIHGGLPVSVPAMTVNRVCGSGAQAIVSAAQEIAARLRRRRRRRRHGEHGSGAVSHGRAAAGATAWVDGQLYDSMLRDGLNDAFSEQHSGWHTEDLVEKFQITREAQDRWALRSQQRFSAAQAAGKFKDEIVPVEVKRRKGPAASPRTSTIGPTRRSRPARKLKPAFRKDGTITAGNAPGLNSGAAAMVVADEAWAGESAVSTPVARLVAYGVAAVEPGMFGLGPGPGGTPGAGARRLDSSATSSASRSTRPSRRSPSRSRASSGCPRTSSTSRAARSRMAIRSAPPARC